jgi:hypothetical protein
MNKITEKQKRHMSWFSPENVKALNKIMRKYNKQRDDDRKNSKKDS